MAGYIPVHGWELGYLWKCRLCHLLSSFTSGASFAADAATSGKWGFINNSSLLSNNLATYGNDFEDNTVGGWTTSGCATITSQDFQVANGSGAAVFSSSNGGRSKGANTTSPAIDSGSNVTGTYSLNLATSGAGTIGDGYVSGAYPIPPSMRAKVVNFSLNYKVASGTPVMAGTSSNTYAIAFYSPADNQWIFGSWKFQLRSIKWHWLSYRFIPNASDHDKHSSIHLFAGRTYWNIKSFDC